MKQIMCLFKLKNIIIFTAIIFCSYIFFFNLGIPAFENWDEAWYADVVRNMLRSGDYITMRWNGEIFLDKPPLYMWIVALFAKIFGGLNEFIMRFPSAFSALLISILVLIYSLSKFGIAAGIIGFGSLVLNNIFVWRARSGNLDLFQTLWILLIYFALISKYKHKYPLIGLLLSLTYLTKAAAVIIPAIAIFGYILLYERKNIVHNFRSYFLSLLIFLLIPALWLFGGYLKVGADFVTYFILHSDQNVSHLSFANFQTSYFSYIYYALQRRITFFLVVGLLAVIASYKKSRGILLLLFTLPLLISLTYTQRSNNWYLIPMFPFISILVAQGAGAFFSIFRHHWVIKTPVLLVCAYIFYRTFTINIYPIINTYSTQSQRESGQKLAELSKPTDIIIRLDESYPATIYYSDRKVYVYKGDIQTGFIMLGIPDMTKMLELGQAKWFCGTPSEVISFASTLSYPYEIIQVNKAESILHLL